MNVWTHFGLLGSFWIKRSYCRFFTRGFWLDSIWNFVLLTWFVGAFYNRSKPLPVMVSNPSRTNIISINFMPFHSQKTQHIQTLWSMPCIMSRRVTSQTFNIPCVPATCLIVSQHSKYRFQECLNMFEISPNGSNIPSFYNMISILQGPPTMSRD